MLVVSVSSLASGGCNETAQKEVASVRTLPALGAKVDETSVSGISSGAYMCPVAGLLRAVGE